MAENVPPSNTNRQSDISAQHRATPASRIEVVDVGVDDIYVYVAIMYLWMLASSDGPPVMKEVILLGLFGCHP